jgi:hypothetical protein
VKKRPGSGYESHKDNYTMNEKFRRGMENTQEDVIDYKKERYETLRCWKQ